MTDLENMLVYAARYAHQRRTGAALQVVNCILRNWDEVDIKVLKQISDEADNEASYCREDWQRIINRFNGVDL